MRSADECKRFCEESILQELKPLEARRKAALKKIILFIVMMIVGMMITLGVIGSRGAPGPVVFGTLVAFLVSIAAGIGLMRFDIAAEFKGIAVAKMVSFLDPSLSYDARGAIRRETFVSSSLFPRKFKLYRGTDLVAGVAGGSSFSFCMLQVMTTRSSGGKHRSRRTVFEGLFFVLGPSGTADEARVVVTPRNSGPQIGQMITRIAEGLGRGNEQSAVLHDPEFGKAFSVRASSPGEAQTILSADLRKKILAMRQKTGHPLALSLGGRNMYVGVSFGADLFTAYLTRTVIDRSFLETNCEALRIAVEIVEELCR